MKNHNLIDNKKVACDICFVKVCKKDMQEHKRISHYEGKYCQCDLCGRYLKNKKSLRDHFRYAHAIRVWKMKI
jgi:hypothetical protein